MQKQRRRVILDTNILISYLLTPGSSRLDKLFSENKIALLFDNTLLLEFITVVKRPKFRKYFSEEDVNDLLQSLSPHVIYVEVNTTVNACRDRKDNFLLALARDGKADYLITGDKDLLELEKFEKTKITTIAKFFSTVNS